VISPAPAEISAWFTAKFVGITFWSLSIELDTFKKAEVPKTLYPTEPAEPLTKALTSAAPNSETPDKDKPVNVGESPVCRPVSTSVCVPFIFALTVPCDGELNVEPDIIL
jgi:hypothetical protein